ncbi:hypothetical protein J2T60_002613 [Natronospira proteinivora]|uniref:DUF1579 domain-containing protein n=1 Tax=Natronospira proteinivora TaxID=1807133 RepID=A0ABT1GBB1_9GAMM|nr:hypothetical protein [Natronospira proteinivora]MCP1728599.1 hypothetical protein [Natronospira proteinivora]
MRITVLILTLFISAMVTPAQACRGDVTTAMDYLPGDWVVMGGETEVLGYSEIREGAGGCALRERWEGMDGLEGEALFTARDGGRRWQMVWSDSDGMSLTLSGQADGADMIFTGTQDSEEGEVLHRIAYQLLFDIGEIHQLWEYSVDGGRNWEVFFAAWYLPEDA